MSLKYRLQLTRTQTHTNHGGYLGFESHGNTNTHKPRTISGFCNLHEHKHTQTTDDIWVLRVTRTQTHTNHGRYLGFATYTNTNTHKPRTISGFWESREHKHTQTTDDIWVLQLTRTQTHTNHGGYLGFESHANTNTHKPRTISGFCNLHEHKHTQTTDDIWVLRLTRTETHTNHGRYLGFATHTNTNKQTNHGRYLSYSSISQDACRDFIVVNRKSILTSSISLPVHYTMN